MKIYLKYILYLFIFPLAFIAITFYLCITTEIGLQCSLNILKRCLPGHLDIEQVHGSLIQGISLKNLHYSDNEVHVIIAHADIFWNLSFIRNYKIRINQLILNDININLLPTNNTKISPKQNKLQFFSWSKYFVINEAKIRRVKLTRSNHSLVFFESILLKKASQKDHLLQLKSTMGNVNGRINLNLASPAAKWDVSLNIEHLNPVNVLPNWNGNVNLSLSTKGRWSPTAKQMDMKIQSLNGELRGLKLKGLGSVTMINNIINITNFQLQFDQASLNISGTINHASHLNVFLNVPQLNKVIPESKGSVAVHGILTGNYSALTFQASLIAKNILFPNLKMNALQSDLKIKYDSQKIGLAHFHIDNLQINNYRLKVLNGHLKSILINKQLSTDILLSLSESNNIHAKLLLPQFESFTDDSQPINGFIKIDLKQLSSYLFIPKIKDIDGNLKGLLNINGKIKQPTIEMTTDLNIKQASLPDLGVKITHLTLHGNKKMNKPIMIEGKFNSGKSTAYYSGDIDALPLDRTLHLNITGDNLLVVNLPHFKIYASPTIAMTYRNNNLILSGTIAIPQADINYNTLSNVVTLPHEIRYVGKNKKKENVFLQNIAMQILITLGDNIHVAYENLDAQLTGKVLVRQTVGSLPIGLGELLINKGKYKAYDKILSIREGRIIYTDNLLTNPGLDIRATQTIKATALASSRNTLVNDQRAEQSLANSSMYTGQKNIIVGVAVSGTINHPNIRLISDPGMSQEDILSYLIFGYPHSQISNTSSLTLLNILASSNQKGTNITFPLKTIQNKLGLSELKVGSTNYYSTETNKSINATTFNIGKKIGKKLSLNYSVGLFDPVSIFSVRYQINKYFSIQSQTSSIDSGSDILYEYEHD